MTGKLVHDDGVFWLIKGAGDMLDEKSERLLVLSGCHLVLSRQRLNGPGEREGGARVADA